MDYNSVEKEALRKFLEEAMESLSDEEMEEAGVSEEDVEKPEEDAMEMDEEDVEEEDIYEDGLDESGMTEEEEAIESNQMVDTVHKARQGVCDLGILTKEKLQKMRGMKEAMSNPKSMGVEVTKVEVVKPKKKKKKKK